MSQAGTVNSSIDYSRMDTECIEMIKFFNEHGLKTEMSCQGHNKTTQSLFWISFDSSVHTADIVMFQSKYTDKLGNFCACGHFGRRLCLYTETSDNDTTKHKLYGRWEYVAAGIEAAHKDLQNWKELEETRRFK